MSVRRFVNVLGLWGKQVPACVFYGTLTRYFTYDLLSFYRTNIIMRIIHSLFYLRFMYELLSYGHDKRIVHSLYYHLKMIYAKNYSI